MNEIYENMDVEVQPYMCVSNRGCVELCCGDGLIVFNMFVCCYNVQKTNENHEILHVVAGRVWAVLGQPC